MRDGLVVVGAQHDQRLRDRPTTQPALDHRARRDVDDAGSPGRASSRDTPRRAAPRRAARRAACDARSTRRSARTARRGCCACRDAARAPSRACRSRSRSARRNGGSRRRARAPRRGTRRRTPRCGSGSRRRRRSRRARRRCPRTRGLSAQELGRQAVHGQRAGVAVATRVDVVVERVAGRPAVQQLDATDFDDAVAGLRD